MAEGKWSTFGVSLRAACYITCTCYFGFFLANIILYLEDRSWQDNSDKLWVQWQWVDISISVVSILAALLLLVAIIKSNYYLFAVFIVWAIVCIVLSIIILGFGFGELEREEIVARSIGIAVTAYFIDVVLSFYLNLKRENINKRTERARITNMQILSLEDGVANGIFSNDNSVKPSTTYGSVRNVQLWYEDTKL